jgi:D-glycero-D-manno-heptose 1,7-bisphosphate phosphatase
MSRAAVFLDRDGVLIDNVDTYVRTWNDVHFLPGVFEAMQRLQSSPYVTVLVTNQSAVGRGIITAAQALEINARIVEEIETHGGRVDGAYLCLHSPANACDCRKPAPGLLLQAQAELELDLGTSFLIGDALTDLQAADAAGVRGILVRTGRGAAQEQLLDPPSRARCSIVPDLTAAVDQILLGVSQT